MLPKLLQTKLQVPRLKLRMLLLPRRPLFRTVRMRSPKRPGSHTMILLPPPRTRKALSKFLVIRPRQKPVSRQLLPISTPTLLHRKAQHPLSLARMASSRPAIATRGSLASADVAAAVAVVAMASVAVAVVTSAVVVGVAVVAVAAEDRTVLPLPLLHPSSWRRYLDWLIGWGRYLPNDFSIYHSHHPVHPVLRPFPSTLRIVQFYSSLIISFTG